MNVSHEYKTVLWLPQRTATRTIAPLFHPYNFINMEHNTPITGPNGYTHDLGVPQGCEDYDIICTVRNPFSWLLSVWHWDNFYPGVAEQDRISFSEYVERGNWELNGFSNHILSTKIQYFIKYESIKDNLKNIPWFNFNSSIDDAINNNSYMSENLARKSDQSSDYLKHYTDKELLAVSSKLSALFKKLNYSTY